MTLEEYLNQEINAAHQRMQEAADEISELLEEVSESPELTTAKAVLEERAFTFELLNNINTRASALLAQAHVQHVDLADVAVQGLKSVIAPKAR